jgi:hypothetical protein
VRKCRLRSTFAVLGTTSQQDALVEEADYVCPTLAVPASHGSGAHVRASLRPFWGMGTAFIAMVGVSVFGEALNVVKVVAVVLIVVGVVMLNMVSPTH